MSRQSVRLMEVGPRDGLQNISQQVKTEIKVELIDRLRKSGLRNIELTSIVSPRAIPQLKDCQDVLNSQITQGHLMNKSNRLPVLVPNIKGVETAHRLCVSEVAVFISATEGFSKANINCTVEEGIARAKQVASDAKSRGMTVRGYISCIFADPFDGPTKASAVLRVAKELLAAGCYEISLGDTLGVGSPSDVVTLLECLVGNGIPVERLAGHFHDTYGQALANVWQAYQCGVRVFDSSVAGLGGCPFAPGATGNVATEDLVYMFDRAGIHTGVDLRSLTDTAVWVSRKLSQPIRSRVSAAMTAKLSSTEGRNRSRVTQLTWTKTNETEGLLVHRAGANLRITLNRPENGNALTTSMIKELTAMYSEASQDPGVSRIAIIGKGKFFCTGMDLAKDRTAVGSEEQSSDDQFQRLTALFETIDNCEKTTISCLNGPAFGGGVGLAFCCDLRIFASNATVTLSEGKLGLCPATISKYMIRELGIPFCREAMLTARPIAPAELKTKGAIVATADTAAQLVEFLDSIMYEMRQVSPGASKMCKELIRSGWAHGGLSRQNDTIKKLFRAMMAPNSPGSYGVKEFQAGRKVDWDSLIGLEIISKL